MKNKLKMSIRLNRLLIVSTCIVLVYTAVQTFNIQMQVIKSDNNIQVLNEQIADQQIINDELNQMLADGATDDAISQVAKEKLGLVVPGERIIVDIGSK